MVEVLLWLNFCSTFSTLINFVGPTNTRIVRKIKPTIGLSHILAIHFDWSKSNWPNIINKFQASSFNVLFDKGHNLKSLGFLNRFVLGKRMYYLLYWVAFWKVFNPWKVKREMADFCWPCSIHLEIKVTSTHLRAKFLQTNALYVC